MMKMIFVVLRHLDEETSKFGVRIEIMKKEQLPRAALFIRFHPTTHMEEYVTGGSLEERLLLKNKLNEL